MISNKQYSCAHTTKGSKLAMALMNGQINLQSIFVSIDPLCPSVAAHTGALVG
jgi:hypothetical protein